MTIPARVVSVRALTSAEDVAAACDLFDRIWHGTPVERSTVSALALAGGYLSGAFAETRMVGACLGFIGMTPRRHLHSHVTGVDPQWAGRGVGTSLKHDQRLWALAHDIDEITWTYDPLIAANAAFNLSRLGARPVRYLPDFYGEMTDGTNAGFPTDRMLVSWRIREQQWSSEAGGAVPLISAAAGSPVVHDPDRTATLLSVATPADIAALRRTSPAHALQWRDAYHRVFATYVESDHWRVVGFHDRRYLLAITPTGKTHS